MTGAVYWGIRLDHCEETLLENNTVSEGGTGFSLASGSNNLLRYNTAYNLYSGISAVGTNNTVIWNTFRDAWGRDAYSTAANIFGYNFYS